MFLHNMAFFRCSFQMLVPWVVFPLPVCVFLMCCCIRLVNPDIFGRVEDVQFVFFPHCCAIIASWQDILLNQHTTHRHWHTHTFDCVLSQFRQAA